MAAEERTERLGAGAPSAARRSSPDFPSAVADALDVGPKRVGRIVDDAVEVLRRRFGALALIGLLVWLPVAAIQWIVLAPQQLAGLDENAQLAASLVWLLTFALASLVLTAATGLVAVGAMRGETVPLGSALGRLAVALPALVVASVVFAVGYLGGLFTCGVLTVYLWWRWQFVHVAIVVERVGPVAGLARSWDLTRRGFWRWMGVFATVVVLSLPFQAIGTAYDEGWVADLLRDWLPGLGRPALLAILVVTNAALMAVPSTFSGVAGALFYLDLRARREGYDLSLRLDAVEGASP